LKKRNKTANAGAAVKTFHVLLQEDVIPNERYAPSTMFKLCRIKQDDNAIEKGRVFYRAPKSTELTPNASEEPHCKTNAESNSSGHHAYYGEKKNNEFEAYDFG
jgi:hypothetical protein